MSNEHPLVADLLVLPIDRTASNPGIQVGGDAEHNSGTGIFGEYGMMGIAVNGSEALRVDPDALTVSVLLVKLANDVCIMQGAADPVDATTGAGIAGPGSLYIRVSGANSNAWINCNTKASPAWKLITRAA